GKIHAYDDAIIQATHFSNLVSDVFVGGDTKLDSPYASSISIQDQSFAEDRMYNFIGDRCKAIPLNQSAMINFWDQDIQGAWFFVKSVHFSGFELASLRCNAIGEYQADYDTRVDFNITHDPNRYKHLSLTDQDAYFINILHNRTGNSSNKGPIAVNIKNGIAYKARYHFNGNKEGENTNLLVKNIQSIFNYSNVNAILTGNFLHLALEDIIGFRNDHSYTYSQGANGLTTTVHKDYEYSGTTNLALVQGDNINISAANPTVTVSEIEYITTIKQVNSGLLAPVLVGGITIFVPVIKDEIIHEKKEINRGTFDIFIVLEEFFHKMFNYLHSIVQQML
ncbi:MAG: hypothetical protein OXE99_05070, partial [Cellvibrionales bacterium]|nr:hypothetical protein [Cellvibrionales bacterium]